jgi:hypothetical protein
MFSQIRVPDPYQASSLPVATLDAAAEAFVLAVTVTEVGIESVTETGVEAVTDIWLVATVEIALEDAAAPVRSGQIPLAAASAKERKT